MYKTIFLTFLLASHALGAEIRGLILCDGVCRLVSNPTTLLAQQVHLQTVSVSYDFTCNPGIHRTSRFTSYLRIKDLGDGREIPLDYFYTSPPFQFSTRGPLLLEDSLPRDMANLIKNPCDLIINVHASIHPDVLSDYGRRIEAIENELPYLAKSYGSNKQILMALLQSQNRLGCSIYNLERDPSFEMIQSDSLKRTYKELYGAVYQDESFGQQVCSEETLINIEDFSCKNAGSPLCLIKENYKEAREQLESKDRVLQDYQKELKDTPLEEKLRSVRDRPEFIELRS